MTAGLNAFGRDCARLADAGVAWQMAADQAPLPKSRGFAFASGCFYLSIVSGR